jgi:hypothetical protein
VIHLSCGGQVVYNTGECVWYCGRCSKVFPTLEDLTTDNQICERSDDL